VALIIRPSRCGLSDRAARRPALSLQRRL